MDIKEATEKIVEKLKNDPALLKEFQSDPVKALEKVSGIDLPEDQMKPVVAAVKAQMAGGEAADILGKLGGLFK